MEEKDLKIHNEYDPLKSVYMSDRQNPDHQGFIKCLKDFGIEVILANQTLQTRIHWPFLRDPFMVIDDTFMMGGIDSSGGISSRLPDLQTSVMNLMDYIKEDKFTFHVLVNQEEYGMPIVLEGGDVIVHNDTIYVGQGGQYTNRYGLDMMEAQWGGGIQDTTNIYGTQNTGYSP